MIAMGEWELAGNGGDLERTLIDVVGEGRLEDDGLFREGKREGKDSIKIGAL